MASERMETKKQTAGKPFRLYEENLPVTGCTISGRMNKDTTVFSLAAGTDISTESIPAEQIILMVQGDILIENEVSTIPLHTEEGVLIAAEKCTGIRALKDSVCLQIMVKKEMNQTVKAGKVFSLKDLVPYRDGQIVNMDIVHTEDMKLAVMAFDQGTGLDAHRAPGDAVVTALEGEGVIGYEGKEYVLHAGENFRFAKNGLHYVKAENGRFKMSLLLVIE